MNRIYHLLSFLIIIFGCNPNSPGEQSSVYQNPLTYAKGFTIEPLNGYTLVQINTPYKGAEKGLRYVLYPRETEKPNVEADAFIPIPVQSIVCTSTTHIPLLDYIGESDRLIGFPTTDYISSKIMRTRIDSGYVADLGIDNAINIEKLIELNPELVMAYTMTSDMGQFSKIQAAGIPVFINAEYMELDPLGRAEWVKLAGLLFNKQEEADSVFSFIEEAYLTTKNKVSNVTHQPTAMSGSMYSDIWYLPGGNNYGAKLLTDAGFDYIWKEDSTTGFLTLSYEVVLDRADKADYWIGASNFKSLKEMKEANERYGFFRPFETKKVYSYNKRIGAKGGSEFLELGYLRPDLILKDLVKIGHPELMSNHELYFYFQLPAK
jgi:cobalamin transport system substrate-binding protein